MWGAEDSVQEALAEASTSGRTSSGSHELLPFSVRNATLLHAIPKFSAPPLRAFARA